MANVAFMPNIVVMPNMAFMPNMAVVPNMYDCCIKYGFYTKYVWFGKQGCYAKYSCRQVQLQIWQTEPLCQSTAIECKYISGKKLYPLAVVGAEFGICVV